MRKTLVCVNDTDLPPNDFIFEAIDCGHARLSGATGVSLWTDHLAGLLENIACILCSQLGRLQDCVEYSVHVSTSNSQTMSCSVMLASISSV